MNPFIRLQDGDANDTERLLLDSASDDAPSPGARTRTLIALGVAAGATAAMPGAVHAAVGAAGSGSAKTAGSMTALMLAKWLGTGAAIGAVTAACIATATTPGWLRPSPTEAAMNRAAPAAPGAPKTMARSAALPGPRAPNDDTRAPVPAVGDAIEARAAASPPVTHLGRDFAAEASTAGDIPGTAAPQSARAGSPGNGSSVLAEVASLDRARAALASGDARSALERLAEHDRRFAGGALEPEAVVLRVRAWLQLGQRAEAVALVNRFLTAHPNSSQAARLRALVGGSGTQAR
jgi:hypothetical protein